MFQKYIVLGGKKTVFKSVEIDAYLTEYNYGFRASFYDREYEVVHESSFPTKDEAEKYIDTVLVYGI